MGQATKTEPVIHELSVGQRFRKRPSLKVVEDFLRHLGRTGSPHTWPKISTTTPAKTSRPVLLKKFTIPDAFRLGGRGRAPCPICCPYYPKYETGYLAWHPDDGLVRAIGQECGSEFFEEGTFDDALATYDREEADRTAKAFLKDEYPKLVELMVTAWGVREDLSERLRMRDEFVAKITKKAVDQLRRTAASDGTLHVISDTGQKDDRGRAIEVKRPVTRIDGVEALSGGDSILESLRAKSLAVGGHACTVTGELKKRIEKLTGSEAVELEKRLRVFGKTLIEAEKLNMALGRLLTVPNLVLLGRYGADRDCPSPFWIKQIGDEVFTGKGIAPTKLLSRHNPARIKLPRS